MPTPIQILDVTDFTGGLNFRADVFQLRGSESPDMLNVDLDPRGGFAQRDSVTPLNSISLRQVPANMWPYATTTGTKQIMVQQGSDFAYSTGGNFTYVDPDALATVGTMRAATFKDLCYIQRNAEQAAVKWDGSTATVLATAFNDNIAAPTGANMIKAKCIASWMGRVWVANTSEAAVQKNRVRFSHPNQPADFRTNDFIDVNVGKDGDEITALVPFQDRLLVFKNNSVHVITGYDANTFQVFDLSQTVGATSQEACAVTEYGVYFFHWPDGVYQYDGKHISWEWERISPKIEDGTIASAQQTLITLGWLKRRLWVGVPWMGSSTNNRTFVLDPTLGKSGGWTQYDLALGPMLQWQPPASAASYLAVDAPRGRVLRLHQTAAADVFNTDYLTLTGASGTFASTPDTVGLSITGDIDLRARVALTDWTPATAQTFVAKWEATANQRAYKFWIDTAGKLNLDWSNNGTTILSKVSTVATGIADGTQAWVRAILDVDNGAVGNDVKFYTSTDGQTWTQLGATVTTAAVTAIADTTALATVGATGNAGTIDRLIGNVYSVAILQNILGTVKGDPEFTASSVSTNLTVTDSQSQVWTLQGAAAMAGKGMNITSYYTTKWFDAGVPAAIKRWRRPLIILKGGIATTIQIDLWRDYDASQIKRTAYLSTTATSGVLVWDDGSHAATMKWDNNVWGGNDTVVEEVLKTAILGRARSVRLKFTGPNNPSARWQIDGIIFKYIPRRIRG